MDFTQLRNGLLILMLIGSFTLLQGQEKTGNEYNLLVGTYTNPDNREGIHVYKFDTDTGEYTYRSKASGAESPSYLAVSKDRKYVYSVNEVGGGKGGASAFSFDPVSGNLDFINYMGSGGDGPAYISVDDRNKFVFLASYGGGSLSAIPIRGDGSLGSSIQSIRYDGHSVFSPNQDRSHVHSTVLSPDNRFLYASDLGTDRVNIYNVDVNKPNPLTEFTQSYIEVEAGSGPRHFTFHPNGKYAYLIQELEGIITVFDYAEGNLQTKQSVNAVSSEVKLEEGNADAADIHVSPDGRYLYASLRADINEIVIYSIKPNGELDFVGRQSTLGQHPRNFVIDPTGNFVLVGNSGDNEIVIFKRNHETGLLKDTGGRIQVNAPVCLKFVAMD